MTVGRRFTRLIQHLGISKNAFAQSLGKTATVIQHLVDERNKPGYDLLCKVFEVYPNVSKDWLLLGLGPMLLSGPAEASPAPSTRKAGVGAGAQAALPLLPESAPTAEGAAVVPPAPVAPPIAPLVAFPLVEAPAAPRAAPAPVASETTAPTPRTAAEAPVPPAETYLTAALHAQHLQHQLALAEQRNQHLLEQQRLMQQLLDLAQRR